MSPSKTDVSLQATVAVRTPPAPIKRAMPITTPIPIDDLSAPTAEDLTLIWPSPAELVAMVDENRKQREGWRFDILGVSVSEWQSARSQTSLTIMTGHQPAFFHPGVWAKNVAAAKLARILEGEATFLIVDSDAPGRELLVWPDGPSDDLRLARAVTPARTEHLSYEQIGDWNAGGPEGGIDWENTFSKIKQASAQQAAESPEVGSPGLLPVFAKAFLSPPNGESSSGPSYLDRWMAGMQRVESHLGVASPAYHRISQDFSNDAKPDGLSGLTFAAHLMLHASEFASAHNESLRTYRERRDIRGTRHPIPDLGIEADRTELPFWIVRGIQPRARLWVSRQRSENASQPADTFTLYANGKRVTSVSGHDLQRSPEQAHQILAESLGEWSIRPRALALTMYARLFLCDLFIHGIGGAKYDQITDDIIQRFFAITPPAYACVSATQLLLPLSHGSHCSEADLRTAFRRQRDIRWNPQRHVPSDMANQQTIAQLTTERETAVAESIRLKQEEPANAHARRDAYRRIHGATAALTRALGPTQATASAEIGRITAALEQQSIATSREWFFALYPREQLQQLIDAISF